MASELDKVSPIWLILALVVVPFGIYQLLNFLSPFVHNLTAMTITEIYVYPIKSLRGVKVTEALGTKYGFQHDRLFMLLEVTPTGHKNMALTRYPAMTQFVTSMDGYGSENGIVTVHFRAYGNADKAKTIKIPLTPNTEKLEPFEVNLHESKVTALKMPAEYNSWFSSCFGYEVVLVYLGPNKRAVMFQDMQPLEADPLTRFLKTQFPFAGPYIDRIMGLQQNEPWRLTFSDCAPYLITSKTSLEEVSSRLPDGEEMEMMKFRPNIVLSGAFEPYQEDYWGRIRINHKAELIMAHNCPRCRSINLDYDTSKQAEGASGEILKKLQHDRRIDIGSKSSPVFGRYSFWDPKSADQIIKVGDRVNVTKVNEGLTVWSWDNVE